MKLLVVSTWLPYPLDNGSRVRAYHLLRHLSGTHELTLLSFGVPRAPEDLVPLRQFCAEVETVAPRRAGGSGYGFRGLLSAVPRHYVQTWSSEMSALVAARVRAHDAAIALEVDAAGYLVPYKDVPRVFEEAEVTVLRDRYLLEPQPLRRMRHALTWWKSRRYVRSLVHDFDRTTVVSEQERNHLREAGCDTTRITVVPNGVAVTDVNPPPAREERLVYPGSVNYSANLDAVRYFVAEVFPLLRRARPQLVFCVTGATDGVEIRDLAATEGVVFTGRLQEIDTLVAASAACVVPLRVGGGTRLKVLQAMALGTPVVSTTKGVEGLDVEPERHVLLGDAPGLFATQVLRILDDDALGRRLAGEAQRLVRHRYAWGPIGDTLEQVLQGAVAEHTARHRGR